MPKKHQHFSLAKATQSLRQHEKDTKLPLCKELRNVYPSKGDFVPTLRNDFSYYDATTEHLLAWSENWPNTGTVTADDYLIAKIQPRGEGDTIYVSSLIPFTQDAGSATHAMSTYSEGTASGTSGTSAILGAETEFVRNVWRGCWISFDADSYVYLITEVTDDLNLVIDGTLESSYSGTYVIYQTHYYDNARYGIHLESYFNYLLYQCTNPTAVDPNAICGPFRSKMTDEAVTSDDDEGKLYARVDTVFTSGGSSIIFAPNGDMARLSNLGSHTVTFNTSSSDGASWSSVDLPKGGITDPKTFNYARSIWNTNNFWVICGNGIWGTTTGAGPTLYYDFTAESSSEFSFAEYVGASGGVFYIAGDNFYETGGGSVGDGTGVSSNLASWSFTADSDSVKVSGNAIGIWVYVGNGTYLTVNGGQTYRSTNGSVWELLTDDVDISKAAISGDISLFAVGAELYVGDEYFGGKRAVELPTLDGVTLAAATIRGICPYNGGFLIYHNVSGGTEVGKLLYSPDGETGWKEIECSGDDLTDTGSYMVTNPATDTPFFVKHFSSIQRIVFYEPSAEEEGEEESEGTELESMAPLSNDYRGGCFAAVDGYLLLGQLREKAGDGWSYKPNRVRWPAPATLTDWEGEGAGWLDCPTKGAILDMRPTGHSVVLFESDRLGLLEPLGDLDNPWGYRVLQSGIRTISRPCVVDNTVYFIADNGLLYGTNGVQVQQFGGFDLGEFDDFELGSDPIQMDWDSQLGAIIIYKPGDTAPHKMWLVSSENGSVTHFRLPEFDDGGTPLKPKSAFVSGVPNAPVLSIGYTPTSNDTDHLATLAYQYGTSTKGHDLLEAEMGERWHALIETGQERVTPEGLTTRINEVDIQTYSAGGTAEPDIAVQWRSERDTDWRDNGEAEGAVELTTTTATSDGSVIFSHKFVEGDGSTWQFHDIPWHSSSIRLFTYDTVDTEYSQQSKDTTGATTGEGWVVSGTFGSAVFTDGGSAQDDLQLEYLHGDGYLGMESSGSSSPPEFIWEIDSISPANGLAYDTFRYSRDGGDTWLITGRQCYTAPSFFGTSWNDKVYWTSDTGHAVGDQWSSTVTLDNYRVALRGGEAWGWNGLDNGNPLATRYHVYIYSNNKPEPNTEAGDYVLSVTDDNMHLIQTVTDEDELELESYPGSSQDGKHLKAKQMDTGDSWLVLGVGGKVEALRMRFYIVPRNELNASQTAKIYGFTAVHTPLAQETKGD